MNKEETLALYAQGRDAWNRWAEERRAEREALEEAGDWVKGTDEGGWNDQTRAWHRDAQAKFSQHVFEEDADFRDFIFPGALRFGEATFSGAAQFGGATFSGDAWFGITTFSGDAWFRGATFSGDAWFGDTTFSGDAGFSKATFSGDAWFGNTTFSGDAWFGEATFSGAAWFRGATFSGDAWFSEATFSGAVRFGGATFSGGAGFSEATFSGAAWFDGATFSGDSGFDGATFSGGAWFSGAMFSGDAGFSEATFSGAAWFDGATFSGRAGFRGVTAEAAFILTSAEFAQAPDFREPHFAEALGLDELRIETVRFWPPIVRRVKAFFNRSGAITRRSYEVEEPARWRALIKLAIDAHDHVRELQFFKGLIKSRRFGEDTWTHGRFWFGLFYEAFSDFGRSFARPLAGLLVVAAGFWGVYFYQHVAAAGRVLFSATACIAGPGEPIWAALQLSARKALLFAGLDSSDKLNQIYACLYGIYSDAPQTPGWLPASFTPRIPDMVATLGLFQLLISAVLIFLFLLALRNHFRIK